MKDDLEQTILKVFTKNVKRSKRKAVTLSASFQKDLGLDSMRLVSILLQFEEIYHVDITEMEADLAEIRTVGGLVAFARNLGLG